MEELVGERHPDFGHDCVFLRHHLPGTNGFNDNCKCHLRAICCLQFFLQGHSSELLRVGLVLGIIWGPGSSEHAFLRISVTSHLSQPTGGLSACAICMWLKISSFCDFHWFPLPLCCDPSCDCDSWFCFLFSCIGLSLSLRNHKPQGFSLSLTVMDGVRWLTADSEHSSWGFSSISI